MKFHRRYQPAAVVFALFMALLSVYASTMSPYVHLEDDGSFILSAYFAGTAHPPGYPLFTLLGYLFTRVELATVAAQVHFVSVVSGAVAAVFVYLCAQLLTLRALPAASAALVFGLGEQFWSQAIIGEVYALSAAIFFAVLYCLLRALVESRAVAGISSSMRYWLYFAAFLFGLGLSNHWPLLLLSAAGLPLVAWPLAWQVLRDFPRLLLCLLAGLLPYAWMYFYGSGKDDFIAFGDIASAQELLYYISREGYADVDQSLTAGWQDKARFLVFFLEQAARQFSLPLLFAAVAGCVMLWRQKPLLAAGLLAVVLGNSLLLVLLLGFDYDGFHRILFMPYPLIAYGIVAIFIAVCAARVQAICRSPRELKAVSAVLLLLPLLFLLANYARNDRKDDAWAEDFALQLLQSLPPDAILFVNEDVDIGPVGYLHFIKKVRPDISLYQSSGMVYPGRLVHPYRHTPEQRRQILTDFIARQHRPVYSTVFMDVTLPQDNMGLLWRVNGRADLPQLGALIARVEQALPVDNGANTWEDLHKILLARRLMFFYNMQGSLANMPEDRLSLLLTHFDAQVTYLDLMLGHSQYLPPDYFSGLLARMDKSQGQFMLKKTLSDYYYLKAEFLSSQAGNEVVAVALYEESVRLNPQYNNRAIKPLLAIYTRNREDAKIRQLSRLTNIRFVD